MTQNNWFENNNTDVEKYLRHVCDNLPVVKRIIEKYGNISLLDYINNFTVSPQPALQSRDDLNQAVFQYVKPLLGESTAKRVVNDISRFPVVLTTTHHGIDYFANSVQGNLIYGTAAFTDSAAISSIPVFSGGNVPLNNATYPRGLLLYAASYDSLNEMPLKLPVFPKKNIGTMVSCASPFNIKMIDNLKNRINKIFREKKISQNALNIINTVLDEDYCSQPVINQDSYSKQSVIINNLLWQRMFSAEIRVPDLVYIEMEQIVRVLLQNDLTNPGSLACRVLFDASVRDYLLDMLDGVRGCWNRKNLVSMVNTGKRLRHETGTVFFWGADELGRRIPLYIVTDSRGSDFLWGADDCGNIWKMPYNTDSVMQGLYEKNIIPSLFTCFLTFSFARGLVCIGGDFQGEYLAQMKKAVAGILKKTGDEESSLIVENVRTDIYQDGMIAFMCPFKEKFLIPAGTLEIIGSGGITKGDMEKVLNMSVMEAHIAGLFETFKDAGGHKLYDFEWKEKIARDILRLLHEKIVIKYP